VPKSRRIAEQVAPCPGLPIEETGRDTTTISMNRENSHGTSKTAGIIAEIPAGFRDPAQPSRQHPAPAPQPREIARKTPSARTPTTAEKTAGEADRDGHEACHRLANERCREAECQPTEAGLDTPQLPPRPSDQQPGQPSQRPGPPIRPNSLTSKRLFFPPWTPKTTPPSPSPNNRGGRRGRSSPPAFPAFPTQQRQNCRRPAA